MLRFIGSGRFRIVSMSLAAFKPDGSNSPTCSSLTEVEAPKPKRLCCSSVSQIVTDNTSSVSETSFTDCRHKLTSSAIDAVRSAKVRQICR